MKIGAYQFAVTGRIADNLHKIENAVLQASSEHVELLIFPECALTGYPPRDLKSSSCVDFDAVEICFARLQELSAAHNMHLVVGSITREAGCFFNSAVVFAPNGLKSVYHKRALWGWDRDNFAPGNSGGILEISGFKIGIRICFEIRFPEYFRELYREQTDLNVILFYDVSDFDDVRRYDMIKAHILTRAVENVCYTLSVDAVCPYQTAPTALFDRSGCAVCELARNSEGLLVYELDKSELDFGERGRKEISDILVPGSKD